MTSDKVDFNLVVLYSQVALLRLIRRWPLHQFYRVLGFFERFKFAFSSYFIYQLTALNEREKI